MKRLLTFKIILAGLFMVAANPTMAHMGHGGEAYTIGFEQLVAAFVLSTVVYQAVLLLGRSDRYRKLGRQVRRAWARRRRN